MSLCVVGCMGHVDGMAGAASSEDGEEGGAGRAVQLPEPALRRLTEGELHASLVDLMPEGTAIPSTMPAFDRLDGYRSVAAVDGTAGAAAVEGYELTAYHVAESALAPARRLEFVGCDAVTDGEACIAGWVKSLGRRVFRRPLTEAEIARYVSIWRGATAETKLPWRAAEFVVAALLQSPHFLYRRELGDDSGEAIDSAARTAGAIALSDWELAARLSYTVWGTTPDDLLLAAAERGELRTDEGLEAQFDRLYADARATGVMRRFVDEWIGLDELGEAEKDEDRFEGFDLGLKWSMAYETLKVFEDIATKGEDLRTVLSTRRTFLNTRLAEHYGVPWPETAAPDDVVEMDLPEDLGRGGLLGRGAFLSITSGAAETSPTHRGIFGLVQVMCIPVAPPPQGVDTNLDGKADGAPKTRRQLLEISHAEPTCAACHDMFDPIGFALEGFDAVGRFRETDNGLPVDSSAVVYGTPVEGAADLGDVLAERPEVGDCIAKQFTKFVTGSGYPRPGDAPLEAVLEAFRDDGYPFETLLRTLVMGDVFRYVQPVSP